MFEDSALAMVLGKLSGKIVEANPAFCRILGYTEAELKELTVFDLTHADDLPGMKERRKAHIEDNVESFPLEKRYIHKDGHAVWVRGTSSLVREMPTASRLLSWGSSRTSPGPKSSRKKPVPSAKTTA